MAQDWNGGDFDAGQVYYKRAAVAPNTGLADKFMGMF